ncbi:MAG: acyltransferase family protein [Novosphingobium sp.]
MQPRTSQRFGYLDSLRFIAASLVVLQHLYDRQSGVIANTVIPLGPGVAGVALFFFISGYAIPLSVGAQLDWRSFVIRRLFRIYPLYLTALLLIFATAALAIVPNWADMLHASALRWLVNLLLVQDFLRLKAFLGVSWTLAIELIWYALFAMTLLAFGSRAARILDTAIPAGLLALAVISVMAGQRIPLGRPTMVYAAVIGFQCFRHSRGEITARALIASVMRFAAVALICDLVAFGLFTHGSITLAQAIGPWAVGSGIFLSVIFIAPLRDHPWLNHGVMPWLGSLSFSIYLLHPLAIALADRFASDWLRDLVAIALTLGLSTLTYRWIEQPGIALGRRIASAPKWPARSVAS